MRAVVTLWRLLRTDPFVPIILLLFYVVAAFLLAVVEGNKQGLIVAVMSAIPAAGFVALFTERLGRYSMAAGVLGVPHHVETMRDAQILLLLLFIVVPAIVACLVGSPPLEALVVLMAGLVVGLFFGMYRSYLFWLVAGVYALNAVVGPLGRWIASPVLWSAVGLSAIPLLWQWRLLPGRVAQMAAAMPGPLADVVHEASDSALSETFGAKEEAVQAYELALDKLVSDASRGVADGKARAATVALGIGYSVGLNVKGILWAVGAGVLALAAWHQFGKHDMPPAAYYALSAWACVPIFGRMTGLLDAWCRHAAEESLLLLTPYWPRSRALKRVIVLTTMQLWRGGATGWVALSLIGWGVGLVTPEQLGVGAAIMLTGCLMAAGTLWATLARRTIKQWQVAPIVIGLLGLSGALTVIFGASESSTSAVIGCLLITVPSALALAWLCLAPLRFPANAPGWQGSGFGTLD